MTLGEDGRDLREDRLPIWAQERLRRLRQRVEDAERRATAARLETQPEASNTILDPYDATPVGLGSSPAVRFQLTAGDVEGWLNYVDAEVDKNGRLRLRGGWTSMFIRPESGNVVTVQLG